MVFWLVPGRAAATATTIELRPIAACQAWCHGPESTDIAAVVSQAKAYNDKVESSVFRGLQHLLAAAPDDPANCM